MGVIAKDFVYFFDSQHSALAAAWECFKEMRGTPLMDDLPDAVVTYIRNDRKLFDQLCGTTEGFDVFRVARSALYEVGRGWLEFSEVPVRSDHCQDLGMWLAEQEDWGEQIFARVHDAVVRERFRLADEGIV